MTINLSLPAEQLAAYTASQLNNLFPDNQSVCVESLMRSMPQVLERLEYCFSHIEKKYYCEQGQVIFSHLNSDHYASYLYFLSNQLAKDGAATSLCEKVFYLNKALHGLDLFYSIKMPDIFLLVHPIGTVIGNASFDDYLVIYQNCTIGSGHEGIYPSFGRGAILYSGVSVIGDCQIGDNCVFGAGAQLVMQSVANDSVIVGTGKAVRILPNNLSVLDRAFR